MSKFNKRRLDLRAPMTATSPVATSPVPDTRTHQGAPAYSRDARSELYLLGLSNLVGETTFHETALARDTRFNALVTQVAVEDPGWVAGYLPWLRTSANMRTAPVSAAVQACRAMTAAKIGGSAGIVDSVLRRPDAPGEALAYHLAHFGRALPQPLKKALARAATRMYTQKATVRYDTASHAFRFGDVIELCHPVPRDEMQARLFKACVDRAHHRRDPRLGGLSMLAADAALRMVAADDPAVLCDTDRLEAAGWVFQNVLPFFGDGSKVSKRALWEAVIPLMGWEALCKNLASFDCDAVSDEVAERVAARLADAGQVRRAQVLPYQMLAAFEAVPSYRWHRALEAALYASLSNIAILPGRNLILIDTSSSMTAHRLSARSKMSAAKAAAVFGIATAHRQAHADVHGFATGVFAHRLRAGGSFVADIEAFLHRTGEVGHGTDITGALRATFAAHDRVFIFTDEQSHTAFNALVPAHVPLYVFNLGGYAAAYAPSGGNVHHLGGLNDATFTMIDLLEKGRSVTWPWEDPQLTADLV